MKQALIINHVAEEGAGTILNVLRRFGFAPASAITNVNIFNGERVPLNPKPFDLIVVMGGPMGVYEEGSYPFITRELKLIENAFKQNVPVIGICLGAQLMAKALGVEVYKTETFEAGWHDIELIGGDKNLKNLPKRFKAFHLHGDTFKIPKDAVHLAKSNKFNSQMFRYNNSYALQFHMEVTDKLVRDMVNINYDFYKDKIGIDKTKAIFTDTALYIKALQKHSDNFFTSIIRHL